MSDNVLKLIPRNKNLIPSELLLESAVELLHTLLPNGEMWDSQVYKNVQFIDQGTNFEGIICPLCKKRTDIDDVADWWSEICEKSEANGWEFIITTPCCNSEIILTDLLFDWDGGFAKYELTIWNPNVLKPLDGYILRQMEQHLGCELKEIWAHY